MPGEEGGRGVGRGEEARRSADAVPPWSARAARLLRPGRPLPRALLAAVGGVLSTLLTGAIGGTAGTLRPTAGVGFAVGAAFGEVGIVGFAVAEGLTALALGAPPVVAVLTALSDAILGAVAFLTFRDVDGIGRGMPNLSSYLWFLGSGLVGGLLTGLFLAWIDFAERFLYGVGLCAVGNLVAILLLGLPALMLADRLLRPWRVALPGERESPPLRRLEAFAEDSIAAFDDAEATVVVAARPQSRRDLVAAGLVILGITLLAAPLTPLFPAGGSWVALLYLLPVLAAAQLYGLRGGLLAASVSGLAYLVATWGGTRLLGVAFGADYQSLALYAQLLLLSPVGALLGRAREREVGLRQELVVHHRLLRRDLLRVVQALTSVVEEKDTYTEAHLRRVGEYAVAVGSRLGLRGRVLETLYYAAMLHDIGKIAIPESMLRKEGPLDGDEEVVMREHPAIGARIVGGLDILRDAAPIILHHQERWDGDDGTGYPGYPHGLRGDEIPLGSRIVAVVDAFDAMTTDRPYRRGRSVEAALAELRAESGRQFDPRVVDAFAGVLSERPWT